MTDSGQNHEPLKNLAMYGGIVLTYGKKSRTQIQDC